MWRTGALVLFRHPHEVLVGEGQQGFELPDPCLVDVTGRMFGAGIVKKPFGFLGIAPGNVQGVFQGGFVLNSRVLFHCTIVVPFPGRYQRNRPGKAEEIQGRRVRP